jgi:hypothetical protein
MERQLCTNGPLNCLPQQNAGSETRVVVVDGDGCDLVLVTASVGMDLNRSWETSCLEEKCH